MEKITRYVIEFSKFIIKYRKVHLIFIYLLHAYSSSIISFFPNLIISTINQKYITIAKKKYFNIVFHIEKNYFIFQIFKYL